MGVYGVWFAFKGSFMSKGTTFYLQWLQLKIGLTVLKCEVKLGFCILDMKVNKFMPLMG